MPIFQPNDRRGFIQRLWSPLLLDVRRPGERRTQGQGVQIYLDVSGSIRAELEELVALLMHFQPLISQPLWAFSTKVELAKIRNGKLLAFTTGGTSINCVLEHFLKTRGKKAVIITDGYVEVPGLTLSRSIAPGAIHAIVTAEGSIDAFQAAGIPWVKLDAL